MDAAILLWTAAGAIVGAAVAYVCLGVLGFPTHSDDEEQLPDEEP